MDIMTLDIETTGLDPMEDDVIEFAAHTDGRTTDVFIDTDRESDPGAFDVHGLTRDYVHRHAKGRSRRDALEAVARLLTHPGITVVAHNVRFAFTMLISNMVRSQCDLSLIRDMHSIVPLDTIVMDRMLLPNARSRSRSLRPLCRSCGIDVPESIGAKADARLIYELAVMQVDSLIEEGVAEPELPRLVARRAVEQQQDRAVWVESHGGDPEEPGYPCDPMVIDSLELDF